MDSAIAVAHPERYDDYRWGKLGESGVPGSPDEWELVVVIWSPECDALCLWGRLKPSFCEERTPLIHAIERFTEKLDQLINYGIPQS